MYGKGDKAETMAHCLKLLSVQQKITEEERGIRMEFYRSAGRTTLEQDDSSGQKTTDKASDYQETIDDAEDLVCALPPALLDTVRDLLFFVYEVNQRAQELYLKAEMIYAQRTIHSGIGNDSPTKPTGGIGE